MSDGDALLATILAEPDADLPRLVFADWLDEFGGAADRARAEFIRVQIELAGGQADVRRVELLARERTLLSTHGEAWLEPLRERGGPLPKTVQPAQRLRAGRAAGAVRGGRGFPRARVVSRHFTGMSILLSPSLTVTFSGEVFSSR
jgi:uncharacterized protein (TIGR02996 family)